MTWTQAIDDLARAEADLRARREELVRRFAEAAAALAAGRSTREVAEATGIARNHVSLLTHRLIGLEQASTGFLRELAPGLDRLAAR